MVAIDNDKAIDLAAEDWKRRMREVIRKPNMTRVGLDAVAGDHRIEFIEFPHIPRISNFDRMK